MSEPKGKPKVLVADDERVIADTLSIILNQAGFEATAVYSGEKAVETAKTLKPDMLISDVIMTDMNGIDAAIKIRGMLPGCKILLFSGQAATADLLDRARVQGHEFEILAKPVHPQDLLARLRSESFTLTILNREKRLVTARRFCFFELILRDALPALGSL
jgi:CheY-like chemotaxis protein